MQRHPIESEPSGAEALDPAASDHLPHAVPELRNLLLEERRQRHHVERRYGELRDIEELKSSFTALACHEIRGAMCVIAGFLDMASEDIVEDLQETTRELLRGADEQMDRLTSLLQQLGDFSQMRPVHSGEAARIPLDLVINNLAPALEAQFGPQGFEMDVELEGDSGDCLLYADLTGLALRALVGNFRRLGAGAVRVHLRARNLESRVEIELSRPGSGLEEELRDQVLAGVGPSAPPPQPHAGGLALGLWIAWRAAATMGGDLLMHSELGSGVRFSLRLPLEAK